MARVFLVRHAEQAAGWGEARDPGLSAKGRTQARRLVQDLQQMDPTVILASPLRRCQETAQPLAAAWDVRPGIVADLAEIPAPTDDLPARGAWLRRILPLTWPVLEASFALHRDVDYGAWRARVRAALDGLQGDVVAVTHFIVVNALVAAATGDDRIMCFRPDHCSVTVMRTDGSAGGLELISLGREAATKVG